MTANIKERPKPTLPSDVPQRRGERGTDTKRLPSASSELLRSEQDAWRGVLGVDFEIQPLPEYVTPEVRRNLKGMGIELRFIPKLEIGTINDLRSKGEKGYLKKLQERYPGWRKVESLSSQEWVNPWISRNLTEEYWRMVMNGEIDFPRFPGVWLAVETMPKPSRDSLYEDETSGGDMLGLSRRFNVIWNNAQAAIQKAKPDILWKAGLPSSLDARMLEVHEWNLLANREGWGGTNTYEWTNTEFHGDSSCRIIVGFFGNGGAAHISKASPGYSYEDVGFRFAIILGS
ncbi:MAG: hypothetical protein M1575_03430 [Patescibacteria group bacterium]|nr:hypothetical protein [Patescibacteria group bacterium]MCL5095751.1 hypothetical protein [Patescibacteria group bacterium]